MSSSAGDVPKSSSFIAYCVDQDKAETIIPTVFSYSYTVELNQEEGDIPYSVREDVPRRVTKAAVETVARRLCSGNEIVTGKQDRSLQQQQQRVSSGDNDKIRGRYLQTMNKCIQSVSAGPYYGEQKVRSGCQTRFYGSQTCTLYMGAIQIQHTDECTRGEVRQDTLMALRFGVDQPGFLDLVNDNITYIETNGTTIETPTVTNVDMYRGQLIPRADGRGVVWNAGPQSSPSSGTSPAQIAIITVSTVLGFAAIVGFFIWRRRIVAAANREKEAAQKHQEDLEEQQRMW